MAKSLPLHHNFEKTKTLTKQKIYQIDLFDDTDYDDCLNNTETNKQNNNTQTIYNCPSKDDIIEYPLDNENHFIQAKVLLRAGKATRKFQSWYDVENVDTKENLNIDFDKVKQWRHNSNETEEVNIAVVPLSDHNNENVIVAKVKELRNWKSFKVFSVVPDEGQPRITTTWVITEKLIDNANTIRARLVARGFQKESDLVLESPTAHKSTLRIVFTLTTNIKSAFLQGQNIEWDLFLVPPKENGDKNKLWKLNKAVYGINDTARQWYDSVKKVIEKLGCIQSKFDHALFQYYSDNKLRGFFLSMLMILSTLGVIASLNQ